MNGSDLQRESGFVQQSYHLFNRAIRRREKMKEMDLAAARLNAMQAPFDPEVDNTIRIDTTLNSPDETMRNILSALDDEKRPAR